MAPSFDHTINNDQGTFLGFACEAIFYGWHLRSRNSAMADTLFFRRDILDFIRNFDCGPPAAQDGQQRVEDDHVRGYVPDVQPVYHALQPELQ